MTRLELISHFREMAGDTVDNPYLWSTELVNSYSVLAEEEACSRKPLLVSSTDEDMCEIPVNSSTTVYEKHSAVRKVHNGTLIYTSKPDDKIDLYVTDVDELDYIDPGWRTLTGQPKYLVLEDKVVQIVPAPEEVGTLWLSVSHVPLTVLASFTIDSAHHFMLVFYMLYLAFTKSDSDTKNPMRAQEYEAVFTAYFGPRPDAYAVKSVRQVRPQRRANGWI